MLIVDTGFWLALANRKDASHQSATQLFQKLENEEFITTWCVVTAGLFHSKNSFERI